MNIQAQINQSIYHFAPERVFGYRNLSLYKQSPSSVVRAVSRLVKTNKGSQIK